MGVCTVENKPLPTHPEIQYLLDGKLVQQKHKNNITDDCGL